MKKVSLDKLITLIDREENDQLKLLYKNTFVLGCYFWVANEHAVSNKVIYKLFDSIGWEGNDTYFTSVLKCLPEQAATYALDMDANGEIQELFFKNNI